MDLLQLIADSLSCLERMEQMSDAVPKHPRGCRSRTGLTCAAEFRGKNPHNVERTITDWLGELLRARGWDAKNERPYPEEPSNGKTCDLRVSFGDARLWLEAKPIWGDWISDGQSGDRVRKHGSEGKNISQLMGDAGKLQGLVQGPRAWHGLLALVFHEGERLTDRVIEAVGSDWSQASRYVPDQCSEPGEDFGCTAIIFWREASVAQGD